MLGPEDGPLPLFVKRPFTEDEGLKVKTMEQDKPIAKFQAGAVSCAVWQNRVNIDGRTATILKAAVSRRYQDRDGIWQTSQSFSRNEVPMAIYVLQKAFATIKGNPPSERAPQGIFAWTWSAACWASMTSFNSIWNTHCSAGVRTSFRPRRATISLKLRGLPKSSTNTWLC